MNFQSNQLYLKYALIGDDKMIKQLRWTSTSHVMAIQLALLGGHNKLVNQILDTYRECHNDTAIYHIIQFAAYVNNVNILDRFYIKDNYYHTCAYIAGKIMAKDSSILSNDNIIKKYQNIIIDSLLKVVFNLGDMIYHIGNTTYSYLMEYYKAFNISTVDKEALADSLYNDPNLVLPIVTIRGFIAGNHISLIDAYYNNIIWHQSRHHLYNRRNNYTCNSRHITSKSLHKTRGNIDDILFTDAISHNNSYILAILLANTEKSLQFILSLGIYCTEEDYVECLEVLINNTYHIRDITKVWYQCMILSTCCQSPDVFELFAGYYNKSWTPVFITSAMMQCSKYYIECPLRIFDESPIADPELIYKLVQLGVPVPSTKNCEVTAGYLRKSYNEALRVRDIEISNSTIV